MSLIAVICMIIIGMVFLGIIDYLIEKSTREFEQEINSRNKHINSFFNDD